MGKREYNAARAEANARYNAKTYKQINFRLRLEDDADILQSLEQSQSEGISNREWLRKIFDVNKN